MPQIKHKRKDQWGGGWGGMTHKLRDLKEKACFKHGQV